MPKVKTKKCALLSCRAEFTPNAFWQKYHTPKCAWTAANNKRSALIRRARKNIRDEEKGVA
jgi:hypothetical protein